MRSTSGSIRQNRDDPWQSGLARCEYKRDQDVGEEGIGGVCVHLYDANGNLIQKTTTDSNGYYGFNVQSGEDYTIEFVQPNGMEFTQPNIGDDSHDSDADPSTGKTKLILCNR